MPRLAPLLIVLFMLLSPHGANAAAERQLSVRLLPDRTNVTGGDTITVGIEQEIQPGWHTYWSNPGDSGTAAVIRWSGLEGIQAAPIQWPAPKRLAMGPLTNFGYENRVTLFQDLTLPETLPPGPLRVTADIDVLVCHEICIPETHQASFTLNGGQAPARAQLEAARSALPLDMGWPASIAEDGNDLIVRIETDSPGAFVDLGSIELYPEEWGLIDNTKETSADKSGNTLILRHPRGDRALAEVPVSRLVIVYQDAAGARQSVRVSTLSANAAPQTGEISAPQAGFLKAALLALLGGLVLNLMPCVFPILSMKALSLVQLKDHDDAAARRHGLAYTAGILVCFAAVAASLIALKAVGAQVGWGFQLQHPAIILMLAYLFFTLGLNLAGYFDIDFGLANAGAKLTARRGISGSFFTGVLATIVATPCTAPFMGVAIGYALTQPAAISLAVFMALGLGLALPYLLLSFVPAARSLLPRPGAWMERFRQFLAFPLFASACWLLWVLSQQVSHMDQFMALLGGLGIAFAIWLWKIRPHHLAGHWAFALTALAVLAFVASTLFTVRPLAPTAETSVTQSMDQGWEEFSRARLESYLKDDAPVFVNMTAAWCITCKVNERVALATPETRALFSEHGVRALKGDWTNQNPEITQFLEEYGRSGVPIYVYYGPRDSASGARPEPVILPQILTPGIVRDAINP